MKKVLFTTVAALSLLTLAACQDNSSATGSNKESQSTELSSNSSSKEATKPFSPDDQGNGTMNIVNESGNSADGKPIVIYFDSNTVGQGFDVSTEGIDGGKLSFLYSDGQLISKEQLADSQTFIELDSDEIGERSAALSAGDHTFQLVQFDNDDQNTDPITIKTQHYTVKDKE